jgi:hypothetical protein
MSSLPGGGGVNAWCAMTTGTFFSGPMASFLTRVTSASGGVPCGVNAAFAGMGCVGQVFCAASCGTGLSVMP